MSNPATIRALVTRTSSSITINHNAQGGYATLTIGVVMLLIITLMTIYATRSGILDIRTAADRARYAQAMAQAERFVEQGFAWVMRNRDNLDPNVWTGATHYGACSGGAAVPCGDGNTNRYDNTYRYVCYGDGNNDGRIDGTVSCGSRVVFYLVGQTHAATATQTNYDIVARGGILAYDEQGNIENLSSLRATAVVKQGIYFYSINNPDEVPAPFVAAGNVDLSGNYSLVTNPNGGGNGVAVSVWTANSVTTGGSSATCQLTEFNITGTCTSTMALSSGGIPTNPYMDDLVENDANFPADLFNYLFGVPSADYVSKKNQFTQISDCDDLSGASRGLIWYKNTTNEECSPTSDVGSADHPVILVVEDADFAFRGNDDFYGILFLFSPNTAGSLAALNGGGTLHGSVINDNPASAGTTLNGGFKLIYDPSVMGKIFTTVETMGLAKLPGSWTDYLD